MLKINGLGILYCGKWTNKDNKNLEIIINGGITKVSEIKDHLDYCDGVMIGRSIYQNPYSLVEIEKEIFNVDNSPTREEVVQKLLEYLDKEVKEGTKVNHIMRHTVGLYHGQVGSKEWKRYLSDNMMARDSDFQKAKHIMTIVQNNEMYGSTTVYAEPGKLETVSLKFNQMGDTPKKMREIEGGMSMGIPMFTILISIITWAM